MVGLHCARSIDGIRISASDYWEARDEYTNTGTLRFRILSTTARPRARTRFVPAHSRYVTKAIAKSRIATARLCIVEMLSRQQQTLGSSEDDLLVLEASEDSLVLVASIRCDKELET
jgi:hypothetical protein